MSQEWDEVLHEVRLMIERLNAFRDDLMAAADGGNLTEDQCAIVHDIAKAAMPFVVHVNSSFTPRRRRERQQEKGDTQE